MLGILLPKAKNLVLSVFRDGPDPRLLIIRQIWRRAEPGQSLFHPIPNDCLIRIRPVKQIRRDSHDPRQNPNQEDKPGQDQNEEFLFAQGSTLTSFLEKALVRFRKWSERSSMRSGFLTFLELPGVHRLRLIAL